MLPDRFEIGSRGGTSGANDDANFAGLVPPGETLIEGLTMSEGDAGDWYLIPTPVAQQAFGQSQSARLTRDMVHIVFGAGEGDPNHDRFHNGPFSATNYFLFPAQKTGADDDPQYVPTDEYAGVPDYYLLHVHNVNTFSITASEPLPANGQLTEEVTFTLSADGIEREITIYAGDYGDAAGLYSSIQTAVGEQFQFIGLGSLVATELDEGRLRLTLRRPGPMRITFEGDAAGRQLHFVNGRSNDPAAPLGPYRVELVDPLGETIDVSAADADFQVDSEGLGDEPTVIPLGDIGNVEGATAGQGDDFIGAVRDNLGGVFDADGVEPGQHPADAIGPTLARIHFGSSSPDSVTFDENSVALVLPAPVLSTSLFGSRTVFAEPGDYDGDGLSDVALAVSLDLIRSEDTRDSSTSPGFTSCSGVKGGAGKWISLPPPTWSSGASADACR